MLSENVGSSCWTIRTCRYNQDTNPVLNHESLRDREVITTSGTSPCAFVKHVLYNGRLAALEWFPPDHPPMKLTTTI